MLQEHLDLRLLSGTLFEFGVLDYEYCDAFWVLELLVVTTDDNACRSIPKRLRRTRACSGFLAFAHFLSHCLSHAGRV
uniref:Uncharacterized protein n=1 Tax=Tanacetum cinerariifolium TaxID=118510 RepID=A0A699V6Q1_TANCI|nr:hypothetical protein [Tanacetum cinerariifolium]